MVQNGKQHVFLSKTKKMVPTFGERSSFRESVLVENNVIKLGKMKPVRGKTLKIFILFQGNFSYKGKIRQTMDETPRYRN